MAAGGEVGGGSGADVGNGSVVAGAELTTRGLVTDAEGAGAPSEETDGEESSIAGDVLARETVSGDSVAGPAASGTLRTFCIDQLAGRANRTL